MKDGEGATTSVFPAYNTYYFLQAIAVYQLLYESLCQEDIDERVHDMGCVCEKFPTPLCWMART